MAFYIGHRGRAIKFVGSQKPDLCQFHVLEVEDSFREIPPRELIDHYEVRRGMVLPKRLTDYKKLRVAFVGVYKIPCGIATYSEWLWAETAKLVNEYKVFAEVTHRETNDGPDVVRCWQRGRPLTELISAIRDYDPDVVFIQHEYGIFPVAGHWIALLSALQAYRTIVTLHSVYTHKDKLICEAPIKEIVVHTEAAKDILLNVKKVHGEVTVIPHGCLPCESEHKYWNLYHSKHTLVQFGFGFRYKGWEQAIRIVAELKKEYPDVFFTGLFSETDGNKQFHDHYFQELSELIDDLDVRGNVGLIRGFQSEECLDSFLRTNRAALFPYIPNGEHTVYGCSGAARVAMSKGIPVVASDVPLFGDLEGICDRPGSIAEFCEAIKKLFTDKGNQQQIVRQNKFLNDNTWEASAKRYLNLV